MSDPVIYVQRDYYLNREIQKGDRVWVYEDPITMQHPEGEATVVEVASDRLGLCRARVRFQGESRIVERAICYPLLTPTSEATEQPRRRRRPHEARGSAASNACFGA